MSGYDFSRFVGLTETEKQEMLCGICLAIFNRPVDTVCGHTFCLNCINQWFDEYNHSCPECRNNLSPIFPFNVPFIESTKRFQNLINKLKIKCNFAEKGCEEVMNLGQLRKHLEGCAFNNFKNISKTLKWIQMKGTDKPRADAVIGGYDINGESIYVGRALQSDDLICGKIVPSHRCCYVGYDGIEFSHQNFEVLTNPENYELLWIPASNGCVPLNAIEGGKRLNGEILYIGRAKHYNSLTMGKVNPNKGLYIPFAGIESHFKYYDVLCL